MIPDRDLPERSSEPPDPPAFVPRGVDDDEPCEFCGRTLADGPCDSCAENAEPDD